MVDACLEDVEEIRTAVKRHIDHLMRQLDRFEHTLQRKKRIIQGFGLDLAPNPDDTEVLLALSAVPNQDDVDHETQ